MIKIGDYALDITWLISPDWSRMRAPPISYLEAGTGFAPISIIIGCSGTALGSSVQSVYPNNEGVTASSLDRPNLTICLHTIRSV